MERTPSEFESDWVHAVFGAFREEVVSIAADFGDRVKRDIDLTAATQGIRPPSATALLTSVAIETGNMATSVVRYGDDDDADEGEDE